MIAERQSFTCSYCGNTFIRKLSKIKNCELVFCNNDCRARYAEKNSLLDSEIDPEMFATDIDYCQKIIKHAASTVIHIFKLQGVVEYKELEHEAHIAIWKFGGKANDGTANKGSFYYSCIKHRMMDYCRNVIKNIQSSYLLDEEQDLIYYCTPNHLYQMKEVADYVLNRKQRGGTNAYALLLKYTFENVEIDDLAKETGLSNRDITLRISSARKQLKKELNERGL